MLNTPAFMAYRRHSISMVVYDRHHMTWYGSQTCSW